jgi:hypothetical protein
MTSDERYSRLTAQFRDGIRHFKGMGALLNEAVTRSVLISPILETLGYTPTHRLPEYHEQGNAPDETCYLRPVDNRPGEAAMILEAKQYGTAFDASISGVRADSPDRQIRRYLQQHISSGPNTIGVLTDGVKWRIYQRTGDANSNDIVFRNEYDFHRFYDARQPALSEHKAHPEDSLADLVELLARDQIEYRTVRRRAPVRNLADILFEDVIANPQPEYILRGLLGEIDSSIETNLGEDVMLRGKRKDTHDNDWQTYAYAKSVAIAAADPALIDDLGHYMVMAAAQYKYDSSNPQLSRADAALCARIFASADVSDAAVVFAYTVAPDGGMEARLVVTAGNQVNMTVSFDPKLPSPSARSAINQLLQNIRRADDTIAADRLLQPLEVAPLRQRFYREVAQWTGDLQRGKNMAERQAILRHLIRVIFAWILKEENIIPPELFEYAFIRVNYGEDADKYHNDALRFLFHQRLNIPRDVRESHDKTEIDQAMAAVPFLNGSLFAEHSDDDLLDIPAVKYWNADTDNPGLFTILSRYHWTTDELRPGESEQTLDPELLSNLFERLIVPTREGTQPPLRQPKGTYYTPADVADEMVKDALAAAVRDYAPSGVTEAELLELFGEADAELPQMTDAERGTLTQRIRELRIFDPAVGSGEFLFSMLVALRRAIGKLEQAGHYTATDIIERQLAGQDIQPLAVQITRLRLFIAIISDRNTVYPPILFDNPLPNLEARIVCADTLETFADPHWRPDRPGRFDTANDELILALRELAANRARWFTAHTETDKQLVLTEDAALRDRLKILLQQQRDFASPELIGFAESPLYNINPEPAHTDARLLFYEDPWRGFDIVIGNPPYEALNKSMTREQVNALKTNKRYQTTNVGDLYSLFCETALALANPSGGVVTMIVPHSIGFGQEDRTIRSIYENDCSRIKLSHYDIRPDTIFNESPTVKTPSNSQRATIVIARLGNSGTLIVKTTGLQRWPSTDRKRCLGHRNKAYMPRLGAHIDWRIAKQWSRIPTKEISDLIQTIHSQTTTIGSLQYKGGVCSIAYPKIARYFISSVPAEIISPRSEYHFTVENDDTLKVILAALNGHVAYGWWIVYGDGFHVSPYHITNMTIPDAWRECPESVRDIGQRLINTIPECIIETLNRGKIWRNANFYFEPGLIEELDRMHLEALGFTGAKQDKLLKHLRIMRSSSSWKYD